MTTAFAHIKYGRIHLTTPYNKQLNKIIRQIPGCQLNKKANSWYFSLPLDMQTGKAIHKIFTNNLVLSPKLKEWAFKQKKLDKQLIRLANSDHAELKRLPKVLPKLYERIYVGPIGRQLSPKEFKQALKAAHGSYQTADVAYMALSPRPLNANQPGLGKTYESIGAIFEAGVDEGPHLIIAPKTAIEVVWGPTLIEMQPHPVYEILGCYCKRNHKGTNGRAHRETVIQQFLDDPSKGKWLIVNPDMLRLVKDKNGPIEIKSGRGNCTLEKCKIKNKNGDPKDAHFHYQYAFPQLQKIQWATVINDECHKGNVRNHKTPTAKGISGVKATAKIIDMSGTPMRSLGVDIWGVLHHLNPQKYGDYWGFAARFFEIKKNGFGAVVGPLREDATQAFYDFIAPDILRRTKAECLPWLPAKQYVDELVSMDGKQRKQYEQMQEEGIYRLGHMDQYSTSVLSELTRLTQFAMGYWKENNGLLMPTIASCKLERTLDILDNHGIFSGNKDEKFVIFSQFRTFLEMVVKHLEKQKIDVGLLSGKQNKKGERREFQQRFQNGKTQVACVVTTAGGVAIDLDMADTAIRLDESYAPDDDEQADDRLHRASRIHQVTIHTIRSKNSIDQLRQEIKQEKHEQHISILDIRREVIKQAIGKN